jgi:basic membrane lipoprotein Med (substrate-binding protein (PBP1-ABC) superfamily)
MRTRLFALSLVMALLLVMSSAGGSHSAQALQGTAVATLSAPIKIALIMPSAKNDLAWSQSMYDALTRVQTSLGGDQMVQLTVIENMFMVPDAAANMEKFASEGYDIVIAHGTQYGAAMFEVAAKFPDTSFAWGTATDTGKDQDLENVFAYEARAEEGGYVFGVMAAMLSKSGTLGVVGPVEAGDAKLYIDGFKQGAKDSKGIEAKVVYTGSFSDVTLATEAAKTLIGQGADVLTGSAQIVPGPISEIQKAKGYWFGTQTSQIEGWADTVVGAQVFDWAPTLMDMIMLRQAGTMGGKSYEISLKNGGLKLIYNDKIAIPDDVKKAGDDAMNKIMDGSLMVMGNPAMSATMAATESK